MPASLNTKLTIAYTSTDLTDTSEAQEEFIIHGVFTKEQFKRLQALYPDFVPHELGLPNAALSFFHIECFPREDIDHGSCELKEWHLDSYEEFVAHTKTRQPPTTGFHCESFLNAYEAAPFDTEAEYERMKRFF